MKSSSKTKYALLGILTIKPMSGYDIKKMIDSSISHFWSESFGQLYPALKQMVSENLLTTFEEINGKKPKIIYTITEKGKLVLKEWLAISPDKEQIRIEPLLKIFFGYNTTIEITENHITELKINFQQKLIVLKEIVRNMEVYKTPTNEYIFPLLTAQYGIYTYEANLKWCNYALDMLLKLKKGEL